MQSDVENKMLCLSHAPTTPALWLCSCAPRPVNSSISLDSSYTQPQSAWDWRVAFHAILPTHNFWRVIRLVCTLQSPPYGLGSGLNCINCHFSLGVWSAMSVRPLHPLPPLWNVLPSRMLSAFINPACVWGSQSCHERPEEPHCCL